MAKERLGSNATFTGTQQGLTTIGDHCYAYSGMLASNAGNVTALEFQSGSEYIIGKWNISTDADALSTAYFKTDVLFNGVSIWKSIERRDLGNLADLPVTFLIPPNTLVSMIMVANGTDAEASYIFSGRTYS